MEESRLTHTFLARVARGMLRLKQRRSIFLEKKMILVLNTGFEVSVRYPGEMSRINLPVKR